MWFNLSRVISNDHAPKCVKYLVFDLDETLGDFGDLSAHVSILEKALQRDLSVLELFATFCAFSNAFRPSTIRMLQQVYRHKLARHLQTRGSHDSTETSAQDCAPQSYKVILYTNNIGHRSWASSICAFYEWYILTMPEFSQHTSARASRLLSDRSWRTVNDRPRSPSLLSIGSVDTVPRLFDAVVASYMLPNGVINEPARSTNTKTYEDLCKALSKLNVYCPNHIMLFVDDQHHPHMVSNAVLYHRIQPYRSKYSWADCMSRTSALFVYFQSKAKFNDTDVLRNQFKQNAHPTVALGRPFDFGPGNFVDEDCMHTQGTVIRWSQEENAMVEVGVKTTDVFMTFMSVNDLSPFFR